ncbi:hypothetical protein CSAL01_02648 [Colletotrichum salicis]|uniref:Uncharacterized protein n=1 Tax=Colletotrichum salicis TaxID=1209931 RepID=A0A135UES7_9PEZI|nr:hypothetical protein CSAL01_02648 [Colletotrichum salicis]
MVAIGLEDQEQEREREKRGMGWEVPLMWRGEMGKGKGGGVMSKDGGDGAARNQRIVREKRVGGSRRRGGQCASGRGKLHMRSLLAEIKVRSMVSMCGMGNVLDANIQLAPSSLPELTLRDAVRGTADREADEMDALNTRPDGQGPRQPIDDNLLDLDGDDDQECLPAGVDPHLGLCNVEITAAGPMTSAEELGEVSSSQKLPATRPKSPGLWSPWRPWAGKEQGKGVSHWFAWPDWSENSLFAALTNVKFPRATADHRPGTEMASLGPV